MRPAAALLILVACLLATTPARGQKMPQPPPQKAVDYRRPAREYEPAKAGTWEVMVEASLLRDDPATARAALARLGRTLAAALAALPEPARDELKAVKVFLMHGPGAPGGGRDNGLEFYQADAPDHHPTLDPLWRRCIVVYSAENYVGLSDLWALKAPVHELAHAYHLGRWAEDQPDIAAAWEAAVARGLYRGVKGEGGRPIDRAYAATNPLEYFAELSCMAFARCDYEPADRAALEAYDPAGFALIRRMWSADAPPRERRPTMSPTTRPLAAPSLRPAGGPPARSTGPRDRLNRGRPTRGAGRSRAGCPCRSSTG